MMIETAPDLKVTGEAGNGFEAIQLCEMHIFDLVLMDIRMPEMDGLQATAQIRERWPNLKVLILTTFNDDDYALEALKRGASGYMLKDGDAELLIRSIRSCMSGGLSLEEQVAAKIVPRLLKNARTKPGQADDSLTPRELDIIREVGKGKSNQEIAVKLNLSVGTVKNNMTTILDKLDLRDRTQLAIYAIHHDIV